MDSQKWPKWSTCWITKCGSSRLRRKTQKHSECEAPRLWPKKEEQTREIACFAVLKRGSSQLGVRRKKILDKSSMKKAPQNTEKLSGTQRKARFWKSHTTYKKSQRQASIRGTQLAPFHSPYGGDASTCTNNATI